MNNIPDIKFIGCQDFAEMDIPEILYKYRDWDNVHHRRIIQEREIYFAPPNSFEDPLDCNIPLRYDLLTDDDILNRYRFDLSKYNPTWDKNKIEEETKMWFDKGLLRDKQRINNLERKFRNDFNNRFGILCLTPVPDYYDMWKNYSNNFTGFCVGFNSIKMFQDREHFGGGGAVMYYRELPVIIPLQANRNKEFLFQVFSKEMKWSFEKEYRLTKMNISNRVVKIPKEIYSEVITGPEIKDKYRKYIVNIVSKKLQNVKLKEAYFDNKIIKIRDLK